MAESPDDALTLAECTAIYAREMGYQPGPRYIRDRARAGDMPYIKPSRQIFRIRRRDLMAFIERCRMPARAS